jgi:hypothetical protein
MAFFNPLVVHYRADAPAEQNKLDLPRGLPESADAKDAAPQTPPPPRPPAPSGAKNGEITLTNIVKLIPGDVVAIYLAAKGAQPDATIVLGMKWPMFLAILCTLVCLLLRYLATRTRPEGANWALVVVTGLAFVIWAHALYPTAPGPIFGSFYGSIAGIVAMLFGIVAPKLVPAEPE